MHPIYLNLDLADHFSIHLFLLTQKLEIPPVCTTPLQFIPPLECMRLILGLIQVIYDGVHLLVVTRDV